jgi:hypothetical protein
VKAFADDPQQAFPGQGQMKPEQLEVARLKREVIKLKAERDILKKESINRPDYTSTNQRFECVVDCEERLIVNMLYVNPRKR